MFVRPAGRWEKGEEREGEKRKINEGQEEKKEEKRAYPAAAAISEPHSRVVHAAAAAAVKNISGERKAAAKEKKEKKEGSVYSREKCGYKVSSSRLSLARRIKKGPWALFAARSQHRKLCHTSSEREKKVKER